MKDWKWYIRLKWHIKELDKTFSNQPSHYSSKRIERMLLFVSANIMFSISWMWLLFHGKISAAEATLMYGAQMVYAGFQTKEIRKDVVANNNPPV